MITISGLQRFEFDTIFFLTVIDTHRENYPSKGFKHDVIISFIICSGVTHKTRSIEEENNWG
jgi:hypothetical protein